MNTHFIALLAGCLVAARASGQAAYEAIELHLPSEPGVPLIATHLNNAGQIAGNFNAPGGRIFVARWEPGASTLSEARVFRPSDFEAPPGVTLGGLAWAALYDTGEGYAVLRGERRLTPPMKHPQTRRAYAIKYFARILHYTGGSFRGVREFESWAPTGGVLSTGPENVRFLDRRYGGDDYFARYPVDASGHSWIETLRHHPEVWMMSDPGGSEVPLPTGLDVLSEPGDYRYLSGFTHLDDAGNVYGTATFLAHPLTAFGRPRVERQEVWVNGFPRRLADFANAAAGAISISEVNRDGEITGLFGALSSRNVALYLPRANFGRGAGAHTITTTNDARAVSRINRQGAMVWCKDQSTPGLVRLEGQLWAAGAHTPLSSLVPVGTVPHPLTGRGALGTGHALLNDRGWIMTSSRNSDPTGPPEPRNWLLRPVVDAEALLSTDRVLVGETVTFTLRVRNLTAVPRTLGLPIGFRFTGTAQFQLEGAATPPGPRVVPAFGSFEIQQRLRATNAGTSTWYSQGRLISPANTYDTAPAYTRPLRVVDRADLLIKRADEPDTAFGVNDEYQSTPTGRQTRARSVLSAEASEFHIRVQNDDSRLRTFRLKAGGESPGAGWEITHHLNGADISAALRTVSGHVLPPLAAGATHQVTLRVIPVAAPAEETKRVVYTLEDSAEPGEIRDAVEAATTALGDVVVTSPSADELVPPGRPYTVRFRAREDVPSLDLFRVHTLPPDGPRTLVARNVPAASGSFVWEVPEDLESPAAHLVAVNPAVPQQEGTSARFRVRDSWRWHRVTGPGNEPQYEKMVLADHAWSFPQTPENVWGEAYWSQPAHDYCCGPITGDDLFVGAGVKYNPAFYDRVDIGASQHPGWPAWVRAFGTAATYRSLQPLEFAGLRLNQPHLPAFESWHAELGLYEGICYGLSLAVMAAFQDPERFDAYWPLGAPSARIGVIPHTNANALDTGHSLQWHTLGAKFADSRRAQRTRRPSEVVEALKALFESDDRSADRFLWFTGTLPDPEGGSTRRVASHAVVPVGMVSLDPPSKYAIGLYDPNTGGGATEYLFVDTADESWSHSDAGWQGARGTGLYLSSLVAEAFEPAAPIWSLPEAPVAPARRGGLRDATAGDIPIRLRGRAGAVIATGGELRYDNGVLVESLPGGFIEWPVTGRPSFPRAFHVPDGGTYRIEVLPGKDGVAEASVGNAGHSIQMRHESSDPAVRLVLRSSPGSMEVVAGAGGTIEWSLHGRNPDGSHHRVRIAGLSVPHPVGLRVAVEGAGLRLAGAPITSTYNLEWLQVRGDGQQVFHRPAIPLLAGSTHRMFPDWERLEQAPLAIQVDHHDDGQVGETLSLSNSAPSPALWPGWQPAEVRLEIRLGPDGRPECLILPEAAGRVMVEISPDLLHWSPVGEVEAGSWLPIARLVPIGQPDEGPWYLRARR